jgi:hypothetical protein
MSVARLVHVCLASLVELYLAACAKDIAGTRSMRGYLRTTWTTQNSVRHWAAQARFLVTKDVIPEGCI